MVGDWRVSIAGIMLSYWHKLLYPYYTLLLFFPLDEGVTVVMVRTREEVGRIQRVENRAWRQIFGAPGYTPVAALQGVIGRFRLKDMKEKSHLCSGCLELGMGYWRVYLER